MREACRVRGDNLISRRPIEANDERERLLEVRDKEIIDQNDILVAGDVGASGASAKTIGEENQKSQR